MTSHPRWLPPYFYFRYRTGPLTLLTPLHHGGGGAMELASRLFAGDNNVNNPGCQSNRVLNPASTTAVAVVAHWLAMIL